MPFQKPERSRRVSWTQIARCEVTGARAGILHTAHGDIETPVFMPVGTQATVKALSRQNLLDLDVKILLGNTYHLFLRPGHQLIRDFGGLHGFMNWPNSILTDSGGFQVFSLSSMRTISEEGVRFQSHLNGDSHLFTPASTVDVQLALGSDILMMLDECPPYPVTYQQARSSMERTVRWARTGHEHFLQAQSATPTRQALFPIVQGSMFRDLRRECAEQLLELDSDGYAVGGLSVGEPRPVSQEMVAATEDLLPSDRPRYAMGVGVPDELAQYVAHGIDMMDCVLPTRNARNGSLFTREGRLIIKNARYRDDPRPIDEQCACYTCQTHSRAYLRHLFQAGELLFSTLATLHNIRRYLDIMKEIRQAILLGNFPEYLRAAQNRATEAAVSELQ